MAELSDDDKALLDFERKWTHFKYAGAKEGAVLHELGMNTTRYYARLNLLIDEPAAWAYDPELVKRLRRLREARRAARTNYGANFLS